MLERVRRVEGHIRFVLMLAEPGGQILIAVRRVLVEDDDDGADVAGDRSSWRT